MLNSLDPEQELRILNAHLTHVKTHMGLVDSRVTRGKCGFSTCVVSPCAGTGASTGANHELLRSAWHTAMFHVNATYEECSRSPETVLAIDLAEPRNGLQLVVTYHNNLIGYFTVGPDKPWKIDTSSRMIVVGKGIPRTMIPLDGVACFNIEEYDLREKA